MDDKELNYCAVEAAFHALDRTYHNYRPRALAHAASMSVSTDVFGEKRVLEDVAIKYRILRKIVKSLFSILF
jgi:hypothetical protein